MADCATLSALMKKCMDVLGVPGAQVCFVFARHASWANLCSTNKDANEMVGGAKLGYNNGGWNFYEGCCYVGGKWWMGGLGSSKNSAYDVLIEVDGGIDTGNAGKLIETGVDVLVAGNSVFSSKDPAGIIKKLKEVIN
ncbi:MAG: hypothetical protein ABSA76_12320 [Bacteroidales bacterium]